MIVTMFWHGGSSYAAPDTSDPRDAEQFASLADARRAFRARLSDPYYPCVSDNAPEDGGPEAWIVFGRKCDALGTDYPDRIMRFGLRGGVVVERC